MRAEEFSYSTIKNDSKTYEMYKRGCPSLVSFVDNIKASSTLKDKKYSYDIENVTFPSRKNCYVQNLPWAEGKTDEGIGESIEFDIMSVYDAYSDGAGRREIRGDIKVSEKQAGYKTVWIPLDKAIEIFGNYETFHKTKIADYGLYRREFFALNELKKILKDKKSGQA